MQYYPVVMYNTLCTQRKRLVQESSSEGKGGTKDDEKTKKLRKRNAELVTVVKTLDEKYKSLKSDYDQLVSRCVQHVQCTCTCVLTTCACPCTLSCVEECPWR